MNDDPFQRLARYLHEKVGIHLPDNEKNRVLLSTRLGKVMPSLGVADLEEMHRLLRNGDAGAHTAFVNAMTTNTTHFWREPRHFEHLAESLADLAERKRKAGGRDFRVWCAASSTGEEPYTLAMIIEARARDLAGLPVKLLATDIDTSVLEKATRGVYPEDAIESLPPEYRERCFVRGRGESAGFVRVARRLREAVTFAQFNLKQQSYPFAGKFDAIFCRNVLIYFSRDDIGGVISRMERALEPHGLLYLGHSETLMGLQTRLKTIKPAVYAFESKALAQDQEKSHAKGKSA